MITFHDFLRIIKDSETTQDHYLFSCYGPNAAISEWWNHKHDDGFSISVIYDMRTMLVYEMEAWDYANEREYRWINPAYREAHALEYSSRSIEFTESCDGRSYIDLEVAKDIMEKAEAMFSGAEYDTRIMVDIDLPDDVMLNVMRMAHEADLTLNEFVERILRKDLDKRLKEQLAATEEQA